MQKYLALVALVGVMFVSGSAQAINYGQPDETHKNVGTMLVKMDFLGRGEADTFAFCTGTLLSPDYFLTAGHCLTMLEGFMPIVEGVWVSFDFDVHSVNNAYPPIASPNPANMIVVDGWVLHPQYREAATPAWNDVGVLHLTKPVTGIAPVELPRADFLAQSKLLDHVFTVSGMGTTMTFSSGKNSGVGDPKTITFAGYRQQTTVPYAGLNKTFLIGLENNTATAQGGFCASDSGSPIFFAPAGQPGGNLQVALVTWGDKSCRAMGMYSRLDLPENLSFLAPYR